MDCTGKEVVTLWVEKNGTVQWRYTPSPSGTPPSLLKGRRLERRESLGVEPGEVSVFVSQGFLLVVNNAVKLQVQLLNYMHSARYPVHDLAIGAQDVEIAMDCAGECHGVFICWSSAGDFGQDGSFHCTYKGLVALIDVDGLGAGGQMIIVIVFSLLFLLCLLKQCSGGGFRRRLFTRAEEPPQRREARARTSELRSQLAWELRGGPRLYWKTPLMVWEALLASIVSHLATGEDVRIHLHRLAPFARARLWSGWRFNGVAIQPAGIVQLALWTWHSRATFKNTAASGALIRPGRLQGDGDEKCRHWH
eukprot:g14177.t1